MNTGTAQNTTVPGLNLQQAAPQTSGPQQPGQQSFSPAPKKNPFNIKMIIGIIILVLTVVGVAAAYFLSQQSQDVRNQAFLAQCGFYDGKKSECEKRSDCQYNDFTKNCTSKPTATKTPIATKAPTKAPIVTKAPTAAPTKAPTPVPTKAPTATPKPNPACTSYGQDSAKCTANRCYFNTKTGQCAPPTPAPTKVPTPTPKVTPSPTPKIVGTPAPCSSLSPSQCENNSNELRCHLEGLKCVNGAASTGVGGSEPTPGSGPGGAVPTPTSGPGSTVNCSTHSSEIACELNSACDWKPPTLPGQSGSCINESSTGPGPGPGAPTPTPGSGPGGAVPTPTSGPGGTTACSDMTLIQCQNNSDRCEIASLTPFSCRTKSSSGPGPGASTPMPTGPGAGGGNLSPICVEHNNSQSNCEQVDGCEWEGGFCQVVDEGASLGNPGECESGINFCYSCPGQLNPAGGCQLNGVQINGPTVPNAGTRGSSVDYCGIVQCDCKGTSGSSLVFTSQVFTSQCSNLPTKYACVNGACQASTSGTGYGTMEMCQENCGQTTPAPSLPPGSTPPPPTVPPTTYQCNSRCSTDAQCQTSDSRFRCVDTDNGKRCRLGTNPNSSQCRPVSGPQCLSITMSNVTRPEASPNTEPNVGEAVRFTCGQVAAAERYVFRIFGPSGDPITLESTGNVSEPFNILTTGPYSAQCQICTGQDDSTCLPFEEP